MKCWRDLAKDCAETGCPMWMAGFSLPDYVDTECPGLDDHKCALVLQEKFNVLIMKWDIIDLEMDETADDVKNAILNLMERKRTMSQGQKKATSKKSKNPASHNSPRRKEKTIHSR